MFLRHLRIHNYKSLRNIDFHPTALAALIGPNASGKSNFANALHFLSEVYQHGLEVAVARKGGFENIAFRKQRRTKAPIEFAITLEGSGRELSRSLISRRVGPAAGTVRLVHSFQVDTAETGIRAEFAVQNETFSISALTADLPAVERWEEVARMSVGENRAVQVDRLGEGEWSKALKDVLELYRGGLFERRVDPQELFINALPIRGLIRPFTDTVSRFAVFQLSPPSLRLAGVPTPNPNLSLVGENLPALVDWLQRKHPTQWQLVMGGMKEIIPSLSDVEVQYLHTKSLGLFFSEEGIGRPWGVDEVSDGTIQSLAHFVAAADPRSSLLVIEEPENSVHPWIIRALMKRFRAVSQSKNVFLTTHSPVLIDLLEPEEAWILSRHDGETSLSRLVSLEPSIAPQFRAGKFKLSQFLDAGFIPQAVPGGVL